MTIHFVSIVITIDSFLQALYCFLLVLFAGRKDVCTFYPVLALGRKSQLVSKKPVTSLNAIFMSIRTLAAMT